MNNVVATKETFSTDVSGLPQAGTTEVIDPADGAVFDLRIAPVANQVGANTIPVHERERIVGEER